MRALFSLLMFASFATAATEQDIRIAMAMANVDAPVVTPPPVLPRDSYAVDLSNIPPGTPFTVTGWHRPLAGEVLKAGNHWHYCPACNLVQQHDDSKFGSAPAHTCPNCGRLIWEKSGAVAPRRQRVSVAANCPT